MIMWLLTEHNINVNMKYRKPTCIKVTFSTFPITDIFLSITNEEAIKSFNDEGIYIMLIISIQDLNCE